LILKVRKKNFSASKVTKYQTAKQKVKKHLQVLGKTNRDSSLRSE